MEGDNFLLEDEVSLSEESVEIVQPALTNKVDITTIKSLFIFITYLPFVWHNLQHHHKSIHNVCCSFQSYLFYLPVL